MKRMEQSAFTGKEIEIVFDCGTNLSKLIVSSHNGRAERENPESRLCRKINREYKYRNGKITVIFQNEVFEFQILLAHDKNILAQTAYIYK